MCTSKIRMAWRRGFQYRREKGKGGGLAHDLHDVFPTKAEWRHCPVEGCSVFTATRTATQVHLWYQHFRNTVVIMEESNLPHSQFPL